jgi:hypothetical protein
MAELAKGVSNISVKGITTLLNNSEGRDKLMKLHQYQARFWMSVLEKSNPELSSKAKILFVNMRTARKLFRLYKTINEYQKFMELLDSPPANTDEINLILSKLS